jgi:TPP-dependent pyruvate/acetoin dehydrogenase alpha subunit
MDNLIVRDLIRVRLSQMLINEKYKEGEFKIPIHLSFGHEAIAVALSHSLEGEDKILLSHRNMAYNLARTRKLRPVMDEYLLLPTGLAKGRLGSMNLMNREDNIIYSSSILANNFSVAAGVAMAETLKSNPSVTFVLGGDGSMEEGSFYESLVMMNSLALSVVVLIENNEWSLGTHISERRIPINIEKMTNSLGVEYFRLEGNDTHNYLDTLKVIRNRALKNKKPICIEVILKTLGDRRNPPSPEYPEGKYINYHAGPSQTVNLVEEQLSLILSNDFYDPIFVASEQNGIKKITELADIILSELKIELL